MKFSTRAEYGLKAMVNLARCYPEQKNIKAISRDENISVKYLERLVGELRKNNLVTSQIGKSGGYTLAKKPALIKVGEIIEIVEGPIAPMGCVGKKCAMEKKCTSSIVWNKVGVQIKKTLYGIKLSELI
ncbi:MAG: Rrf2 family transcriptional regulator [Parcubacteria group bacterium]|jgi:Rrf2 family protein